MEPTTEIYVWADGDWMYADEIEDMDVHLSASGLSDDYTSIYVPDALFDVEGVDHEQVIEAAIEKAGLA